MADNEGPKLVPGGVRSFVPKRPIRAAIIVFVVTSVLGTIWAIASGKTVSRYIDVGIASAFLAFVIIGAALAARRLRRVLLWCAVGLCLVSLVSAALCALVFYSQLSVDNLEQLTALRDYLLLGPIGALTLVTAAAVSGWVRFACRDRDK